jgi:hypothetical protein
MAFEGHKDKFGSSWGIAKRYLCPACGQPTLHLKGECTHKQFSEKQKQAAIVFILDMGLHAPTDKQYRLYQMAKRREVLAWRKLVKAEADLKLATLDQVSAKLAWEQAQHKATAANRDI